MTATDIMHTLTVMPDKLVVQAPPRAALHEVLDQHGVSLTAYCDGLGTCGKCIVMITCADGTHPQPSDADTRHLTPKDLARGMRLACQWRVTCDATITIPRQSRLERLHVQRKGGDVGTINVARVADAKRPYGMAIDIGSTTVAGALLDLRTGRTVAVASQLNLQRRLGADVISRITHAVRDGGLAELHTALMTTLQAICTTACGEAGITPAHLVEIVVTGNTVMLHALHRASMESLAALPFKPSFYEGRSANASALGMTFLDGVPVYSFPIIGGFVGGDTVGCMLAVDMDQSAECAMVIDIGTNGEVALGCRDGWVATSAPAGPAFEGARISCGMPGAPGAIEHVRLNNSVTLDVIGQVAPVGICGTGLIDAVALLLDVGLIDETGRLLPRDELPATIPDWLRRHVVEVQGEAAFLLAEAVAGDDATAEPARPLHLTQRDIRELQLAKAAIATACALLLRKKNMTWEQVRRVYLAGAFGNYLRPATARRIGLLPPIPMDKIAFIGNAATTGAKRALVSFEDRARAERIAGNAEHIELAAEPDFQMCYADNMLFTPPGDA
jgi:uncharacterized 2Fe-2S/4Fe-4S cluster protein (DUF4445 family)